MYTGTSAGIYGSKQVVLYNELADLPAATGVKSGSLAAVVNDPTPANNGTYLATGADLGSNATAWTKT